MSESPTLDDDGKRWLFRRIRWTIASVMIPVGWDDAAIDRTASAYVENWQRYAEWTDDEHYRGDGYACGRWSVNLSAVKRDLRSIHRAAMLAYDASRFLTLDDWLRADIAEELTYCGAEGGLLGRPDSVRCRTCRKLFTKGRRSALTCVAYRAAKRKTSKKRTS